MVTQQVGRTLARVNTLKHILQIWAELARIRGGGSTSMGELMEARATINDILKNVEFCSTTGKLV